MKQEEEDLLRKIIEEKMDIRGGYSKPAYTDVLWFQLILLPYYIYKLVFYITFNCKRNDQICYSDFYIFVFVGFMIIRS